MEKNAKILLVVCIVLIALLSLTVGMLIGNQQNTRLALNNINNTNMSINMANNTTTTKNKINNTAETQKSKYISRSQAMAVANSYASKYGQEAAGIQYIDFIDGKGKYYGADGDSYYHVDLKWKPGHSQPYDAGYVEIDAANGKVNPRG